jgi:hypothetical protein
MSTKPPNIFISWSGPRSKHIAKALNEWLPTVLQSARPWFSTLSIDKGSRPLDEIAKALDSIEIGISCLTPENLTAPWLLYEAGALSKRIGTKARLCTYLLGGLGPESVPPPLGMFQHTRADKEETKHMLRSINIAISDDPVPEQALDKLFDKMWPDVEQSIKTMPLPEKDVPEKRSVEEMVAEVLDILRSSATPNEPPLSELSGKAAEWMRAQNFIFKSMVMSNALWDATSPRCPNCSKTHIDFDRASGRRTCRVCLSHDEGRQ